MRLAALLTLLVCLGRPGVARAVEVPVDFGIGPSAFFLHGPVVRDQLLHTGLKLDLEAVLDRAWLKKNQRVIPQRYRSLSTKVAEVRYAPTVFIPDALLLSPKLFGTGIYGLVFRPLSAGIPFGSEQARFTLSAGLVVTTFFLHSDRLPTTLFLRPGIDVTAALELRPTPKLGVVIGWQSALHVPQRLGHFLDVTPFNETVWHIGQAFLQLRFRTSYDAKL